MLVTRQQQKIKQTTSCIKTYLSVPLMFKKGTTKSSRVLGHRKGLIVGMVLFQRARNFIFLALVGSMNWRKKIQ